MESTPGLHTGQASPNELISPMEPASTALSSVSRLTDFHLFAKLPTELRCITWSHAFWPRTVEMRFTKDLNNFEYDFVCNIPATLHVNQESREEALKIYKLSFQSPFCAKPIYFCSSLDTLHIRTRPSRDSALPNLKFQQTIPNLTNKNRIEKLSLHYAHYIDFFDVSRLHGDFPALKDVILHCEVNMKGELDPVHAPHCHKTKEGRTCFIEEGGFINGHPDFMVAFVKVRLIGAPIINGVDPGRLLAGYQGGYQGGCTERIREGMEFCLPSGQPATGNASGGH